MKYYEAGHMMYTHPASMVKFKKDVDALIKKGMKKDEAILRQIRELIIESKNIRFEGNGYSDEWVKEAAKRKLNNIKDTPRAMDILLDKSTTQLYEELDVLSKEELEGIWHIVVRKAK